MKTNKNIIKHYIFPILMIVLLIAFDQITKAMAVTKLKGQESFTIIKGVFQLHYLENKGAAFGIMQNKQMIFTVGAFIIIAIVVYFWQKYPFEKKYNPLRICCVLIIAGAIGNMIDRMIQNYVIDFFYFELIDFPIFNVADIYVTVSCLLFAYLIIFHYNENDLKL